MVLYFSATGNTEYIAKELANRLNDKCLNLLPRIKNGDYSEIYSDTPFVICTPVYVCEMPIFFVKFLKKLRLAGNNNAYFVFTSGGYAGISACQARRITRAKKMRYLGRAEFKMPRNYIASNAYSELDFEEIRKRINDAAAKLDKVYETVKNGEKLKDRHIYLFEKIIIVPFTPVWCRFKQPSKPFAASDKCVACGKCAELCPLGNIRIVDGKPVWKTRCAHCMACISNCPTEAIEYGNITQKKFKYTFNKFKARDKKLNSENRD